MRHSLVKLMTDGILLAEIQRDRMLLGYDTIIIDEAHERSLNIDFLLGYLKQLLPRRPDLKLIITSATIDPQRFADYFDGARWSRCPAAATRSRCATGRSPIRTRRRTEDRDQVSAICDAVLELRREPAGDVLVFLSGEREIRDAADAITALQLADTEVLPLYARLSAAEQHRVFAAHPRTADRAGHQRGRDLADGARHQVRDRHRHRPDLVATASAPRCSCCRSSRSRRPRPSSAPAAAGAPRTASASGCTRRRITTRRPEFTDPEILRTNLASVILQMASLDLGPIERFGFLDPPDARQVADGVALLTELGALETATGRRSTALTELGRRIAQLPVDPRLARMIIEAERRGCLRDVLVLAAALSIQDPRERPVEHQQAADQQHARFADPTSDFAGLPEPVAATCASSSRSCPSNQFRRMCRAEYLNYLRIREWQDLFGQLRQIVKGMGVRIGDQPADPEQIHRSLLAGLLSHIGLKDAATPRLPRRAQRPVRDLPRLGAVQEAAAVRDGGRAGGDVPAVGPGERGDPTGMGRGTGRRTWSSAATANRTGNASGAR